MALLKVNYRIISTYNLPISDVTSAHSIAPRNIGNGGGPIFGIGDEILMLTSADLEEGIYRGTIFLNGEFFLVCEDSWAEGYNLLGAVADEATFIAPDSFAVDDILRVGFHDVYRLPVLDAPHVVFDENTYLTAERGQVVPEGTHFEIAGGADAALFAIDPASGELSLSFLPDFEAPTDRDRDNIYEVDVRVADAGGAFGIETVSLTVADVAERVEETAGPDKTSFVSSDAASGEKLSHSVEYADGRVVVVAFEDGVRHLAFTRDLSEAYRFDTILEQFNPDGTIASREITYDADLGWHFRDLFEFSDGDLVSKTTFLKGHWTGVVSKRFDVDPATGAVQQTFERSDGSLFVRSREGDNTLRGGSEDDRFIAGPGADIVVLDPDSGHDRVFGFDIDEDRLDLNAYGIDSLLDLADLRTTAGGAGLDIDGTNFVVLRDVAVGDLSDDIFV